MPENHPMKIKAFYAIGVRPYDGTAVISTPPGGVPIVVKQQNGKESRIHLPVAVVEFESKAAFVGAVKDRAEALWDILASTMEEA